MKIKAYTSYNERNKIHRYRNFDVVDKLPEIGEIVYGSDYDGEKRVVKEIREVGLDCEQGNDEVYGYDYYEIVFEFWQLNDDDEWICEHLESDYVAVEKEIVEDEEI